MTEHVMTKEHERVDKAMLESEQKKDGKTKTCLEDAEEEIQE